MIAKIAVSAATFAIDKSYSYRIPDGMEIRPGDRVSVPFGRGNRRSEGVVLSVEEDTAGDFKSIEKKLDEEPLLSETMLRLAAFMRERYFCTFYDAARVMLPGELRFKRTRLFALLETEAWKVCANTDAVKVLEHIQNLGGSANENSVRSLFPDEERFQQTIKYIQNKKWIAENYDFSQKTGEKTEKIATLVVDPSEALRFAAERPQKAHLQRDVLNLLCTVGSAAVKEITYYTGASLAVLKRLEQLGLLKLSVREVLRMKDIVPNKDSKPILLNEEQQKAYEGISEQMLSEAPGAALLYGITGSGKTAVFIKLIQRVLDMGKSALFLVPEIALTPQLLSMLAAYFGENVAVIHSNLSPGERYDSWQTIRKGNAKVVVGTRSAVFVPIQNPGIIIIDEEQEHSYASENSPRYDAREVALWRGTHEKALVLFGSATPCVESMYYAKTGKYMLYTLKNRYNGQDLPEVKIVDMRTDLENGNDLNLSLELQSKLKETMEIKKQSILFLNRRGNSRALVCVSCRQSPECPRCSARLTFHSANQRLMCHHCGYSQTVPDKCPSCGGSLKQIGCGTQKVQQELEFVLPGIKSLRMDTDTITAANTHEMVLDKFKNENIPVLIGTQMVAKGLNLPNVTLVGVLDADTSLYADTYRAAENTFNMLTQVVGRAGRGDSKGTAIIQTLVPEHRVLQLAAKQDYDSFYDMEIELRRIAQCPPFGDVAVVTFFGEAESAVLRSAVKYRDSLTACLKLPDYKEDHLTVLGPAPCPVPKVNYQYRYRLMLHGKLNRKLRLLVAHLLRQFAKDKENHGVAVYIDVNSLND